METNIAGQAILDNYIIKKELATTNGCLLYTSDAADEYLKSSPAAVSG